MCPKDSPVLDAQVLFRDYLRQNSSARDDYAALKQSLAENYRHDINAYVDGKHEFIIQIAKTALNQRNSTYQLEVETESLSQQPM